MTNSERRMEWSTHLCAEATNTIFQNAWIVETLKRAARRWPIPLLSTEFCALGRGPTKAVQNSGILRERARGNAANSAAIHGRAAHISMN